MNQRQRTDAFTRYLANGIAVVVPQKARWAISVVPLPKQLAVKFSSQHRHGKSAYSFQVNEAFLDAPGTICVDVVRYCSSMIRGGRTDVDAYSRAAAWLSNT